MSYRNGPGPLEDVEATAELPRRLPNESDSQYLRRCSIKLGHTTALPEDVGYTPETARLARKVLNTPSYLDRLKAIWRGDFDKVKPGEREPGSEG